METMAMPSSVKPKKKAVNLSIDAHLAAEAKSFGTNLSATLEKALHLAHRDKRADNWRRENRQAVEAWNKLVEEDGLWIDKYRIK
jgi:antitoxin CcdA